METSYSIDKSYGEYYLLLPLIGIMIYLSITYAQEYIFLIPLFLFGILVLFLLKSICKGLWVHLYLLLCITFFENDPGLQLIEIPFYLFSVGLALYFLTQLFQGKLLIVTTLDKLFLLLHLLIPYSIIIGIINSSSIYLAIGESTYFFGLLAYFPIRSHYSDERFRKILFFVVCFIFLYVIARNLIFYREILIQSTLGWQTQKARVSTNELILLASSLFSLSGAINLNQIKFRIPLFGLFLLFALGLILTQSRGYWLAFFLGIFSMFIFSNRELKLRLISSFSILSILGFSLIAVFLGDYFQLVIEGLAARFSSIGSGKLDISLLERLYESQTVLNLILNNPISGYGFGYPFSKKLLFYDYFISTPYVHNGYLAAWFKFGLIGILLFISIFLLAFTSSIKLYRTSGSVLTRTISLAITSIIAGMLLVNNTSPQTLSFDSILFLSLFCSFLSSESSNPRLDE